MRIAARLKRGTCDHVTRPQSSLLLEYAIASLMVMSSDLYQGGRPHRPFADPARLGPDHIGLCQA
jgi:hypothetical protein